MICPKCGELKTRSIHTLQVGGTTQRIRRCVRCDYSFNTTEKPIIMTFSADEKKEYEEYLEGET